MDLKTIKTLLVVYVLGGLTFLPLLAVCGLIAFYFLSPIAPVQELKAALEYHPVPSDVDLDTKETVGEGDDGGEKPAEGVDVYKTGWLRVAKEFQVGGKQAASLGKFQSVPSSGYLSTFAKRFMSQKPSSPGSSGANAKRVRSTPNDYYAVLKHGNLFLYDYEDSLQHVIVLSHYIPSIYPHDLSEGEIYTKRTAICLTKIGDAPSADDASTSSTAPLTSIYIYISNMSDKEDWYDALLRASPNVSARAQFFDKQHFFSLQQTLNSGEKYSDTKWLNAIIGRLFLATYKTPQLEQFIVNKIVKKIKRVQLPSFMSNITINEVHLGDAIPYISNPRLREMTVDGDLLIDFHISYKGKIRVDLGTTISLPFKNREGRVSLAVVCQNLSGTLQLRIKPAPSNRIWFGFTEMPTLDILVEPITFGRAITFGRVLKGIEGKIRDVVRDSIVSPNMEDLPFLNTTGEVYRGGIWEPQQQSTLQPELVLPLSVGDAVPVEPLDPIIETPIAVSTPKKDNSPVRSLGSAGAMAAVSEEGSIASDASSLSSGSRSTARPGVPRSLSRESGLAISEATLIDVAGTSAHSISGSAEPSLRRRMSSSSAASSTPGTVGRESQESLRSGKRSLSQNSSPEAQFVSEFSQTRTAPRASGEELRAHTIHGEKQSSTKSTTAAISSNVASAWMSGKKGALDYLAKRKAAKQAKAASMTVPDVTLGQPVMRRQAQTFPATAATNAATATLLQPSSDFVVETAVPQGIPPPEPAPVERFVSTPPAKSVMEIPITQSPPQEAAPAARSPPELPPRQPKAASLPTLPPRRRPPPPRPVDNEEDNVTEPTDVAEPTREVVTGPEYESGHSDSAEPEELNMTSRRASFRQQSHRSSEDTTEDWSKPEKEPSNLELLEGLGSTAFA
ncbi:hypothetical protein YB2330_005721 [Saitoella coloradoensis]